MARFLAAPCCDSVVSQWCIEGRCPAMFTLIALAAIIVIYLRSASRGVFGAVQVAVAEVGARLDVEKGVRHRRRQASAKASAASSAIAAAGASRLQQPS